MSDDFFNTDILPRTATAVNVKESDKAPDPKDDLENRPRDYSYKNLYQHRFRKEILVASERPQLLRQ